MSQLLNGAMPRAFRKTLIRNWRKHRNLTLEQMADALDMSASHLSMLERGKRGYTQETLERIAAVLKTDTGSLLTVDPLSEPYSMWTVWAEAKPAQKRQIVEIAKALIKTGT